MDGGSVLSVPRLRIRVRSGEVMRPMIDLRDDLRRPLAWPFGVGPVEAQCELINGTPWIVIPGIPVGLPLPVFKRTAWEEDLVDVDVRVREDWIEIVDDNQWGQLNAGNAKKA